MPARLLLISNSTQHGRGYLDHVEEQIHRCLAGVRRVRFVPFALFDRAAYTARARERLERMGFTLDDSDGAEAVFVGGGNTFRLLKALQETGELDGIRR